MSTDSAKALCPPGRSAHSNWLSKHHESDSSVDCGSLLANMRFTFQRVEQSLYVQLSHTPNDTLNDVRRTFLAAARGVLKRLSAWETKHLPKVSRAQLAAHREAIPAPVWWSSGHYTVPGGNVIVQEEDWGSIIAFTLRFVPE